MNHLESFRCSFASQGSWHDMQAGAVDGTVNDIKVLGAFVLMELSQSTKGDEVAARNTVSFDVVL